MLTKEQLICGMDIVPWLEEKNALDPGLAQNTKYALNGFRSFRLELTEDFTAYSRLSFLDGKVFLVDDYYPEVRLPEVLSRKALGMLFVVDMPNNVLVSSTDYLGGKSLSVPYFSKIAAVVAEDDRFVSNLLGKEPAAKVIKLVPGMSGPSTCGEDYLTIVEPPMTGKTINPDFKRVVAHEMSHFYVGDGRVFDKVDREISRLRREAIIAYGGDEKRFEKLLEQRDRLARGLAGLKKWQNINGQGMACLVDSLVLGKDVDIYNEAKGFFEDKSLDLKQFDWEDFPKLKPYSRRDFMTVSSFFHHLNRDFEIPVSGIADLIRSANPDNHDMGYICASLGLDLNQATQTWTDKLT